MTPAEILDEIYKLPPVEQRFVKDSLQNGKEPSADREDEFVQLLLADGVISEIPQRAYDPEEEDYEPIVVEGEPLSELITRERR